MKVINGRPIQINKISKSDRDTIARVLLPHIEEYFKRPGVEDDFKKWLKERNKICV